MKFKQKLTILILALAFGLSSFTNNYSFTTFDTGMDTGGGSSSGEVSCIVYSRVLDKATFKRDREVVCGSCTTYEINPNWAQNGIGAKYKQKTVTATATIVDCKATTNPKDKCTEIIIVGIKCPPAPPDADDTGTGTGSDTGSGIGTN